MKCPMNRVQSEYCIQQKNTTPIPITTLTTQNPLKVKMIFTLLLKALNITVPSKFFWSNVNFNKNFTESIGG